MHMSRHPSRARVLSVLAAVAALVGSLLPGAAVSVLAASPNTWVATGSLSQPVTRPTVVVLADGRVLSLGGDGDPLYGGTPVGYGPRYPQIYSPTSGTWTTVEAPPWAGDTCVGQWAARMVDGTVLVGGGTPVSNTVANTCDGAWVFDPDIDANGSWTTVERMPVVVVYGGATLLLDGRVVVVGLYETGTPLAYVYDPETGDWTGIASPPSAGRDVLVMTLPDGRVLAGGGYIPYGFGNDYVDTGGTAIWDPVQDQWTNSNVSWSGRGIGALQLADGRVATFGGLHLGYNQHGTCTFDSHLYVTNPTTNVSVQLASMPAPRAGFAYSLLPNGQILVAGGLAPTVNNTCGVPTSSAIVYDWATNAWYPAASMTVARGFAGSATLDDGRLLAIGGTTATSELYTPGADLTPPGISVPLTSLRSGVKLGSSTTVPGRVTWAGTDAGGSGIKSYDVARSYDGGAMVTIATGRISPYLDVTLNVGHRYRFQVRGRDNAGHVGPWRVGLPIKPGFTQGSSTSVKYAGTWTTSSSASFLGGSVRYGRTGGASASLTFTGRSIGFITTRGSTRGAARIYVDGVLQTTVNLYASSTTYRFVAFQKTWTTSATHTIKIVVVGTAGHPRVDLDAFVALRNP